LDRKKEGKVLQHKETGACDNRIIRRLYGQEKNHPTAERGDGHPTKKSAAIDKNGGKRKKEEGKQGPHKLKKGKKKGTFGLCPKGKEKKKYHN